MYGRGVILRVDLTSEKISREPMSSELCQKYLGGEGVNARLLWEHFLKVDPKIDPLSPDNILVVGMGPLGATGLGLGSKTKWTFKSPATNIYGDTSSGGLFGSHLRWAGYDHIVITGRAKRPVYLWIHDDIVEIRDASHLWGKTVRETDDMLKEELGNDEVETAGIGQAGENLVNYASIIASRERIAGRCGGGCVLGSKNLKAIAALGTKGIEVNDPTGFLRSIKEVMDGLYQDPKMREKWKKYGTLALVRSMHDMGYVSYRNAQGNLASDEVVARMDEQWYVQNLQVRNFIPCSAGCASACGNWCLIKGDESEAAAKYAGEYGVRPEYGNWATFAGGCSIKDLPAVVHLTGKCTQYGMDTFEIGMGIALLMELWERGIITAQDTNEWMGEPLSLDWGNWETVDRLIDAVALKKNMLGEILKGNVYQTAVKIEQLKGVPVLKYAIYGKGGAAHEQTVRGWPAMAIALAVCPIGAHHTKGLGVSPGTARLFLNELEAAETLKLTLKGAAHALAENLSPLANSLGTCWFLVGGRRWDPSAIPTEMLTRALRAVTGIETTPQELYIGGERLVNLVKAFNSRLGLRRKDDMLCERWSKELQPEGISKGWKADDYIEKLKDEYYEYHGWDKVTSLQRREKLEELGMEDVIKVLEKEGGLA